MSGQGDKGSESLSGSATSATTSHVKASSASVTATSAASSTGSLSSIGSGSIMSPHIQFKAESLQVYEAKTQPPDDTTTLIIPFYLAADSVIVGSITWYWDSKPNTDLLAIGDRVYTATRGFLFQQPTFGKSRKIHGDIDAIINNHSYALGYPLVFGIEWTAGSQQGITYSPAFSIVKDDGAVEKARELLATSKYVDGIERNDKDGSEITGTRQSASTTSISASNTASTTISAATPDPSTGLNTSGSKSVGQGGRGLSTGAVAGIAVGVGIAALLAAALAVFFFLRRRRRRRQAPASSASDSAAALELEQKRAEMENLRASGGDANGAAATAADADAPYRDDTTTTTTTNNNNTAAAASSQHERRRSSAAAAKQLPATPPSRSSTEVRAQGVSRHLVEEGMTDAEIRRLEAEEAHLDDEIQRASAARR